MAECYLCGCRIASGEGHRRRVKVGASRNMFAFNWRYYYADKMICGDCSSRGNKTKGAIIALALTVSFVAYEWFKP